MHIFSVGNPSWFSRSLVLFSLVLSLSFWSNQSAFVCHVMGSLYHHSAYWAQSSTSWKRPSIQCTCRIFPFCGQFCSNTVKIWVSLITQCTSGSIPVFPPCVCCGEVQGDSMDHDWKRVAVFLLFVKCVNCSGTGKTDHIKQY